MGIVGCRNDNQVYVGIVKQMLRLRDNRNRWPVGFYFCFITAGDYRQFQPGRARNQGRMEGFARNPTRMLSLMSLPLIEV